MTTAARTSPVEKGNHTQRREQKDQWIRDVDQEAHQGRLMLSRAISFVPNCFKREPASASLRPLSCRSNFLQDGIGIDTRLF